MVYLAVSVAVVALSGCITTGPGSARPPSAQRIVVITDPPGAECVATAPRRSAAVLHATPGVLVVERSPGDATLTCRKDGYLDASALLVSGPRANESDLRRHLRAHTTLGEEDIRMAEDTALIGTAAAGAVVADAAATALGSVLLGAAFASPAIAIVALPALAMGGVVGGATLFEQATSGEDSSYPPAAVLSLIPASLGDKEGAEALLDRIAAALRVDDARLRARVGETCGLQCRRRERELEAFIAARHDQLARSRTSIAVGR